MVAETVRNVVDGNGPVRWLLAVLTVLTTAAGVVSYTAVLGQDGFGLLDGVTLGLFAILLAWIVFSFWTATLGLVRTLVVGAPRAPAWTPEELARPLPPTAIIIPVYNECPLSVFSAVRAMIHSLKQVGNAQRFEIFVLSDTRRPEIWLKEERAWAKLAEELPSEVLVFYRRRLENKSRKAGNVADFCERWGDLYRYMIVLDADSLMDGPTMVEMVRRMEANPRLGILQVPPKPVNRTSLFARLQQFSAHFYSPVFLTGFISWARSEANYWGHNAIIRVEPFKSHCSLPALPGAAPLGGEILSHDFVEAALLLRSGWSVEIAADLQGSYEECPTTLRDYAIRDQRWCQGNLQHVRLMFSDGFRAISRLHFGSGAFAYVASPLWVSFVGLSALNGLFPDRGAPVATGYAFPLSLFAAVMGLLLVPKFWAVLAAAADGRRIAQHGGWLSVLGSVLLETVISVIIAPVMAIYHTTFVVMALLGRSVGWNAQNRSDVGTSFRTAFADHWKHTLLGAVILGACVWLAPGLVWWYLPLSIGLLLSIGLSVALGSSHLGQWLQRRGLLLIPEEIAPPELISDYHSFLEQSEREVARDEGVDLFTEIITDPKAHAVHLRILEATASSHPATPDQAERARRAILGGAAQTLPDDVRRAVLSDRDLLKDLHLQWWLRKSVPG